VRVASKAVNDLRVGADVNGVGGGSLRGLGMGCGALYVTQGHIVRRIP
jgi:hypothetical protein